MDASQTGSVSKKTRRPARRDGVLEHAEGARGFFQIRKFLILAALGSVRSGTQQVKVPGLKNTAGDQTLKDGRPTTERSIGRCACTSCPTAPLSSSVRIRHRNSAIPQLRLSKDDTPSWHELPVLCPRREINKAGNNPSRHEALKAYQWPYGR